MSFAAVYLGLLLAVTILMVVDINSKNGIFQ